MEDNCIKDPGIEAGIAAWAVGMASCIGPIINGIIAASDLAREEAGWTIEPSKKKKDKSDS